MPGVEGEDTPAGTSQEKKNLSLIKSLPYLQGYKTAPEKTGVLRYDREAAYPGLNFYLSGSIRIIAR